MKTEEKRKSEDQANDRTARKKRRRKLERRKERNPTIMPQTRSPRISFILEAGQQVKKH